MEYLIYSIEDDKDIAYIINVTLTKQGYTVKSFADGKSFWLEFERQKPNMILLDMMLPDIPGQEILKQIRAQRENDDIDIIIISANHMLIDKVDGLDLGADDYIEKPFDLLELMSRVNVKVRRYKKNRIIHVGDYQLDIDKRECYYQNNLISLTAKEFDILTLLFQKVGKVVTREELLNQIWGMDTALETRTIDMHIKSLRNKLGNSDLIITIYGVGYQVKP
ncbi:MAG TPA: response regulator transcription factor [Bacilli bacterium]|jgi:two-component system alkaline phosphatase synthesis response regulator PhoP|nr:response regulator transcription factor [Acholeplasmataceae bacterium]HNZ78053.1 response regulator transcription factor [Bacilli bacterium]HOD61275.1 response regulator transcription factor [Bacilli bacterium]HOE06715.1 response regulator transcription factor [Bacilli bacterium]HOH61901.1 response regulator transcription factor [Bacilli bacterium]